MVEISWDTDTCRYYQEWSTSSLLDLAVIIMLYAAQGETVALAYFNGWADSFIMKSTDNGDNWTKTIFHRFPS